MNGILRQICLLSIAVCFSSDHAAADDANKRVRAGFSFGAIKTGGAAISVDTGPVFNQNVTAGFELFNLRLVSLRALMWERPANISGFNGGPKLYLGFGSKFEIEPGAEVGWLYRMKNRVDVGVGIDLVVSDSIGGSIKIGAGLLF
ncbi:MAG: hypothetical protein RI932_776 [Pseudomonadota bacterium]